MRHCDRCDTDIHPLVDYPDLDDHLVLVEQPLRVDPQPADGPNEYRLLFSRTVALATCKALHAAGHAHPCAAIGCARPGTWRLSVPSDPWPLLYACNDDLHRVADRLGGAVKMVRVLAGQPSPDPRQPD